MQIWFSICVRCTSVQTPSETPKPKGPTARGCRPGRGSPRSRSRSNACGATRLHAHASGRGARSEPLDLQPAHPAIDRDDRDAVGYAVDSRRRAPASARGTPPASSAPSKRSSAARASCSGRDRCRRPNPSRTRRRQQPPQDRARTHRRAGTDGTRRRPMVAVNRTCSPSPISGLSRKAGTSRVNGSTLRIANQPEARVERVVVFPSRVMGSVLEDTTGRYASGTSGTPGKRRFSIRFPRPPDACPRGGVERWNT
jgi:hypothetical protein